MCQKDNFACVKMCQNKNYEMCQNVSKPYRGRITPAMAALQVDEYSEGNDLLFMLMFYCCNTSVHVCCSTISSFVRLVSGHSAFIVALTLFFCSVLALQPNRRATAEVEESACSTLNARSLSL